MTTLYVANMRFPNEKAHGKQVRDMCNALVRLGPVELIVPTRRTEGTPASFGLDGRVRVVRLAAPDIVHLGRLGFWIESAWFAVVAALYARFRAGAVLTREFPCAALCALLGKRVAWESHRGEWNAIVSLALRLGARLVVISRGLRDFYAKRGVAAHRILVAPDGVDLSRYASLPSRAQARLMLGLPASLSLVVYNGHLHTWKGAGTLAEAASYLPQECRVIFMGGTDKDIAEFKERYGSDPRVQVIGRKNDAERPLYLRAADAVVLPNTATEDISALYTSPLKLFGYMAAGAPIVASDLPSIREVLSDDTAFFAAADDPHSFAEAIGQALEQHEEAAARGDRARARAAAYDWSSRAEAIIGFLS